MRDGVRMRAVGRGARSRCPGPRWTAPTTPSKLPAWRAPARRPARACTICRASKAAIASASARSRCVALPEAGRHASSSGTTRAALAASSPDVPDRLARRAQSRFAASRPAPAAGLACCPRRADRDIGYARSRTTGTRIRQPRRSGYRHRRSWGDVAPVGIRSAPSRARVVGHEQVASASPGGLGEMAEDAAGHGRVLAPPVRRKRVRARLRRAPIRARRARRSRRGGSPSAGRRRPQARPRAPGAVQRRRRARPTRGPAAYAALAAANPVRRPTIRRGVARRCARGTAARRRRTASRDVPTDARAAAICPDRQTLKRKSA